jgi:hypothetical protein
MSETSAAAVACSAPSSRNGLRTKESVAPHSLSTSISWRRLTTARRMVLPMIAITQISTSNARPATADCPVDSSVPICSNQSR